MPKRTTADKDTLIHPDTMSSRAVFEGRSVSAEEIAQIDSNILKRVASRFLVPQLGEGPSLSLPGGSVNAIELKADLHDSDPHDSDPHDSDAGNFDRDNFDRDNFDRDSAGKEDE